MKKKLVIVLTCVVAMFLVACGSEKKDDNKPGTEVSETTNSSSQTGDATTDRNPVEDLLIPATSSASGAYATIKVSKDVELDDESAWLGLCPAGTDYITELEADEVDVIYFYADNREEGDPYVFACDFSEVEDGTYALVVTSSDDAEVGYVAIQLEMTKKGDKVSFDFENAQLKKRPAK